MIEACSGQWDGDWCDARKSASIKDLLDVCFLVNVVSFLRVLMLMLSEQIRMGATYCQRRALRTNLTNHRHSPNLISSRSSKALTIAKTFHTNHIQCSRRQEYEYSPSALSAHPQPPVHASSPSTFPAKLSSSNNAPAHNSPTSPSPPLHPNSASFPPKPAPSSANNSTSQQNGPQSSGRSSS